MHQECFGIRRLYPFAMFQNDGWYDGVPLKDKQLNELLRNSVAQTSTSKHSVHFALTITTLHRSRHKRRRCCIDENAYRA